MREVPRTTNQALRSIIRHGEPPGWASVFSFARGTAVRPEAFAAHGQDPPASDHARALEIVSNEEAWSRGALARTRRGEPCVVCDPEAVRFCAVGAISRAVFELLGQSDMTVVDMAASRVLAANNLQEASLPTINDLEGREMIVSLFQKALA